MRLERVLLERFRRQSLGHFYIVKAKQETALIDWAKNFLVDVLIDSGLDAASAKRRLDQGHPDILWLTPKDDNYKIENDDFGALFSAMAHKPLELAWRFIVVEKPHSIGDVYANKLLKTLEEPSDYCSILFLHSESRSLLQTIESRAITLNLNFETKNFEEFTSSSSDLAGHLTQWCRAHPELFELAEELPQNPAALSSELAQLAKEKGQRAEECLMNGILRFAQQHIADPAQLSELIRACEHGHQSRTFHNSNAERFFTLIHALS